MIEHPRVSIRLEIQHYLGAGGSGDSHNHEQIQADDEHGEVVQLLVGPHDGSEEAEVVLTVGFMGYDDDGAVVLCLSLTDLEGRERLHADPPAVLPEITESSHDTLAASENTHE